MQWALNECFLSLWTPFSKGGHFPEAVELGVCTSPTGPGRWECAGHKVQLWRASYLYPHPQAVLLSASTVLLLQENPGLAAPEAQEWNGLIHTGFFQREGGACGSTSDSNRRTACCPLPERDGQGTVAFLSHTMPTVRWPVMVPLTSRFMFWKYRS